MMVEPKQGADGDAVADNAADMSRFTEATARLFAEQTAAMAVMTVYGIRAASEMTSMMLGALRGHVAEAQPGSVEQSETGTATSKVVPLRKVAPEPADTPPALEPASESAKPPVARARKAAAPKPSRAATASKNRAPARTEPAKAAIAGGRDDLKKISGIGPRLEQVLNERGITRYADLAAMSRADLRKLDGALDLDGRIVRDDWAGQAKALSGGKG